MESFLESFDMHMVDELFPGLLDNDVAQGPYSPVNIPTPKTTRIERLEKRVEALETAIANINKKRKAPTPSKKKMIDSDYSPVPLKKNRADGKREVKEVVLFDI